MYQNLVFASFFFIFAFFPRGPRLFSISHFFCFKINEKRHLKLVLLSLVIRGPLMKPRTTKKTCTYFSFKACVPLSIQMKMNKCTNCIWYLDKLNDLAVKPR